MEPTSIAVAFITLFGTLSAAYVAYRGQVAKVEADAETKVDAARGAVTALEGRIPYKVAEFSSVTTLDEDGSGTHSREWWYVTSDQHITNLRIPIKFSISGQLTDHVPAVKTLPGSDLPAHFEPVSQTNNVREGVIVLDGLLSPGRRASFGIEHRFEKAFTVTKEECLEQHKNDKWKSEYTVSDIVAPTSVFKRSLNLPPSHHGTLETPPSAVVFQGPGELVDPQEMDRIKSSLASNGGSSTLVVNEPKIGYRYGISWMPPPASRRHVPK